MGVLVKILIGYAGAGAVMSALVVTALKKAEVGTPREREAYQTLKQNTIDQGFPEVAEHLALSFGVMSFLLWPKFLVNGIKRAVDGSRA